MGKKKPVVLVVKGDDHIGSTLGLCPAQGVMLPEAGRYTPSDAQRWAWDNHVNFWDRVEATKREVKGDVWGIHLGDSVEGDHHGTTQLITADPEAQSYLLTHALAPMKRACKRLYVCRGTEAHVGSGGDDATGRWLGAERHPDTETWAADEWRLNIYGVRVNARHHANMGNLPWTKNVSAARLAAQLFHEYAEHAARSGTPNQFPHLAFRGHQHRFADSGGASLVRVIFAPAWQLATRFVHRISQTTVADIGGIITVIEPDGQHHVTPVLYTPALSTEVV